MRLLVGDRRDGGRDALELSRVLASSEQSSAVVVTVMPLGGPPAETLAEACEDGVDLLVAGSCGYGPLSRVLLGSGDHTTDRHGALSGAGRAEIVSAADAEAIRDLACCQA